MVVCERLIAPAKWPKTNEHLEDYAYKSIEKAPSMMCACIVRLLMWYNQHFGRKTYNATKLIQTMEATHSSGIAYKISFLKSFPSMVEGHKGFNTTLELILNASVWS